MLVLDCYCVLRNSRRGNADSGGILREDDGFQDNRASNSSENTAEEIIEFRTFKARSGQRTIQGVQCPTEKLTSLLELFAQLVQGMVTTHHLIP